MRRYDDALLFIRIVFIFLFASRCQLVLFCAFHFVYLFVQSVVAQFFTEEKIANKKKQKEKQIEETRIWFNSF